MKTFLLITILLSTPIAHAEYDVKVHPLSTKIFTCSDSSASFKTILSYNLITKTTDENYKKRFELLLNISDARINPSLLDQWAADILNLPVENILAGIPSPYGSDQLTETKKIIFPLTQTQTVPAIRSNYDFTDGYYTSPGVVSFKENAYSKTELIQLDYETAVKFKLLTESTAEMSIRFLHQGAFRGVNTGNGVMLDDRTTSTFNKEFANLKCVQSEF